MTANQQWLHSVVAAAIANTAPPAVFYPALNQLTDRGLAMRAKTPGVYDFAPNPGFAYTDTSTASVVGTGDAAYWTTSSGMVSTNHDNIGTNAATNNLIMHVKVFWPAGTTPNYVDFQVNGTVCTWHISLYWTSNTNCQLTVFDSRDEFTTIIPLTNITRNGDYLEFQVQLSGLTVFVTDLVAGAYDVIQSPWLGTGGYATQNLTSMSATSNGVTPSARVATWAVWTVTP